MIPFDGAWHVTCKRFLLPSLDASGRFLRVCEHAFSRLRTGAPRGIVLKGAGVGNRDFGGVVW